MSEEFKFSQDPLYLYRGILNRVDKTYMYDLQERPPLWTSGCDTLHDQQRYHKRASEKCKYIIIHAFFLINFRSVYSIKNQQKINNYEMY